MSASITLQEAHAAIAGAEKRATEIGVPMNIAVVDAGNNLTAFSRQDGAWLGSIEIAQNKAFTARAFDMPTADLAEPTQPGGPLYGIEVSNGGQVVVFPGGIPLMRGDTIVGAVGVSGGQVDQDQTVAEAAVAAYEAAAA